MITVTVQGRTVYMGSPIQAGSMFDNGVEEFEFTNLPLLDADQTVSLHWITADGGSYGRVETMDKTENGYKYTVSSVMSHYPKVVAFVRITSGDTIWNTQSFVISLNKLPVIDGETPGIPPTDVIQQALNILNQGIVDITTYTDEASAAAELANDAANDASTAATAASSAAIAANNAAEVVDVSIADHYADGTSYEAGDYVLEDGRLYRFTADHSSEEEWKGDDPDTDVVETVIGDELKSNRLVANDVGSGEIVLDHVGVGGTHEFERLKEETIGVMTGEIVRVDVAQSYTDEKKATGRANIGAASEAEMEKIISIINDRGSVDVLEFSNLESNEARGVTFSFNDDGSLRVSGTATADGAVHNFFYDKAGFPTWLIKGHTYSIEYESQSVNLQVWFYKNGNYYTGNSYKSNSSFTVPSDAGGCILRLSVSNGTTVDETISPHIYSASSNAELQTQVNQISSSQIPYRGVIYASGNIDDIANTGVYMISNNATAPTPYGTLLHLVASDATKIQIMYGMTELVIYYRRWLNGVWSSWISSTERYKPNPHYRNKTYIAFGDSLTYGALWNTDTSGETVQTRASWGSRIPDRIANVVNCTNYSNLGVGGMGYLGSNTTFLDYIQNADISNANLITIMGGRNDGGYPLGTDESEAGDATICGQIAAIIEYVRSVNSTCQIVVIQTTPYAEPNENPFTKVYTGNWSLDTFDEQVSKLCKKYCVGYCSWYGCSLFATWGEQSGGGGNYAHMREDAQYEQMGDFIAGQVSRWFLN